MFFSSVFLLCVVYKLLCFMITTTQTLAIISYFISSIALQFLCLYDYFYVATFYVLGCLQDELCHFCFFFLYINFFMMYVGFLLSILWCKC